MQGSEQLVQQAHRNKGKNDALWLRGCCVDLYDKVPAPVLHDAVSAWPAEMWDPGTYYTDASGGINGDDPMLRRVGVGACRLSQVCTTEGQLSPEIAAHLEAPLPGEV